MASHLHQSRQISFRDVQPGQPDHHGFVRTGLMGKKIIVNRELNTRCSVTMVRDVSHPVRVLVYSFLKMLHPAGKILSRFWRQSSPFFGQGAVVKRHGNVLQHCVHSNLADDGLQLKLFCFIMSINHILIDHKLRFMEENLKLYKKYKKDINVANILRKV